ncbi:unnamed protein product [Anisakis simplex]|uniref:Secreted protein n=1 Tax=Anisakis simplex TaxID=6269 RepID=A0A0M3JBX9_ANISI|nr:unnamed protein product [Anisakis simplex]
MFLNYLQTVIIVSFVQLSIATYSNAFLQPIYYSTNQMFGCHCPPPPPPRAPCPPVKQCPPVPTSCPKPQPCKSKSTKSKAQGTTNLVAANTIDELETVIYLYHIRSIT